MSRQPGPQIERRQPSAIRFAAGSHALGSPCVEESIATANETRLRTKTPTTVVIADGQPLFRKALRQLLTADPSLRVIDEAEDGREAATLVRELRPDVLLLDLTIPVVSGLDVLNEISITTPATRTLVLTAEVGDSDVIDALRLGARGIVMKHDPCATLFKSIRTVMAGEYWVGRECMGRLIDMMRALASAPKPEPAQPIAGLTPRELEFVLTIAGGYPNGDDVQKFSISMKTVKHHLANILDKVGVSNRFELALFAVQHRLES